jgi:UMF1 family MFS transporter
MAVDFGLSIGITSPSLMIALLIVQFVGFPSSLLFGLLAKRLSAYVMIISGIVIYIVVCGCGVFVLSSATDFMVFAGITGIAQGGIQALSRSCFGKMVPEDQAAEYFGFFNIVSRFAVILGPIVVGSVAVATKKAGLPSLIASRVGMASLTLLFITGIILLVHTMHQKELVGNDR